MSDDDFGDVDDAILLTAESHPGSSKRPLANSDVSSPQKKARHDKANGVSSRAQSILERVWGFSTFRYEQKAAIDRLIDGHSAVVVFPTGGGKSLVYQIPALAFDEYDTASNRHDAGVTLVVSPLIALMKDQVDALKKRGVAAAAMDSSQSREAWLDTCESLRSGRLRLLYVAPERLNNEGFVEMISHTRIRMIAIDEAHCISEWGHAFRPDYLKVARFTKEIRAERVLCLTATATPRVIKDICSAFDIKTDGVFRTSTYRPNLRLLAESFETAADKTNALISFMQRHKQEATVIYVHTHNQTEEISAALRKNGTDAVAYHAGMTSQRRSEVQDHFMQSRQNVIVATIAFGMGIDKNNIRNIVHYAVPKSLEGYSQEIGRAGRDGKESICVMYLCPEDIRIIEEWSRADMPSLRSVRGLVGELMEHHRNETSGSVIERNLTEEAKDWDLKRSALDMLNAQLELRFELIRAITPRYSTFKYTMSSQFARLTADQSPLTIELKKQSTTAKKFTTVNVESAAKACRVDRAKAVQKLQEWNDTGAIELSPSGVINRFKVLKQFPGTEKEKLDIANSIYAEFDAREKSDMQRVQDVISLVTKSECLNRGLARYFGSEEAVPEKGCSHCNFCQTKAPVPYHQDHRTSAEIDETKIGAVLAATKARDDARFLARICFGISSPRVTAEKLGKHEVFGSMADCDFEGLVNRFLRECREPT